jgi:hypothetical protein
MKNDEAKGCLGCLLILFALVMIIFYPFVVIWALNTIFPVLALAYTWKIWLAISILSGMVSGFLAGSINGFLKMFS